MSNVAKYLNFAPVKVRCCVLCTSLTITILLYGLIVQIKMEWMKKKKVQKQENKTLSSGNKKWTHLHIYFNWVPLHVRYITVVHHFVLIIIRSILTLINVLNDDDKTHSHHTTDRSTDRPTKKPFHHNENKFVELQLMTLPKNEFSRIESRLFFWSCCCSRRNKDISWKQTMRPKHRVCD